MLFRSLDIIEEEGLVAAVDRLQYDLARTLAPLRDFDAIGEVRAGVGLLAAVDFTDAAKSAGVPARVLAGLRERGVLTRLLACGAVQVSPSFVIDETDLSLLGSALADSLAAAGSVRRSPVEVRLLPDITSDEGVDSFDDRHYLEQRPPHH